MNLANINFQKAGHGHPMSSELPIKVYRYSPFPPATVTLPAESLIAIGLWRGVASRVAMTLMRHSDRRLTNKIYTDENLLGTWAAFDALPNYAERASQGASQGASQRLFAKGQNESSPVTTNGGGKLDKTIATIEESPILTLLVTSSQNYENGGSGGARTRNLCRDRAAL